MEKMKNNLLTGSPEAIAAVAQYISTERPKSEIKELMDCAIEAMVSQSDEGTEGLNVKLKLYPLFDSLLKAYTKIPGHEGIPEKMSREELQAVVEKICVYSTDEVAQNAKLYDDLTALAIISPEETVAKADEKLQRMFAALGEGAYAQTISVGAGVVDSTDDRTREVAKKCLINVAEYGNSKARRFAIEALELFPADMMVRKIVGKIEQTDPDPVLRKIAGAVMKAIRENDEIESAIADGEFLVETQYQDPTMPQRMYIEAIFDAVVEILRDPKPSEANTKIMVLMKQLTTFGVAAGPMGELIDNHDLLKIRKNVVNAMVHALVFGDEKIQKMAASAIEKVCAREDAVGRSTLKILDRVATRHRNDIGDMNETGARIRVLVAKIQKSKFGKSLPPPLPPRARIEHKARTRQHA
ncbi:hypothetical protein KKE92_04300 [Candidatus Micrarchaeota archaeon]|nr:hypothetical protein [Candidatus Micrarchaeota archaeon]MBU1681858.1 hypothetical protein [Candidatus Micrarchaeota archaeon]